MKVLRRILGVMVMIAGVIGLLMSLAGLAGIWIAKPTVESGLDATISTLNSSITTSQKVMVITSDALGATVDSVDALSTMLGATALSVESTGPVLESIRSFMGDTLPSTLESASSSLQAAQQGAAILDSTMKSLDSFRFLMSSVPVVGAFIQPPKESYNPEVSLADSLGDVATNLEDLPTMFTDLAANLDKADDSLGTIQSSLETMSTSVGAISKSLGDYQSMVEQSNASMENLKTMLTNFQTNLSTYLTIAAVVLSLFFFWLLAAQVVIFSQGYELYQGTAGRMESSESEVVVNTEAVVEAKVEAEPEGKID